MHPRIKVLLMAGGRGSRLWPKSRRSLPKQFMSLNHNKSLFQQTMDLLQPHREEIELFVLAPREFESFITGQAPDLPQDHIILEPTAHGTSAGLLFALLTLQAKGMDPNEVVAVLPTDAYVGNTDQFWSCISDAVYTARETHGISVLGVIPTYPATGYGYIRAAKSTDGQAVPVEQFVEKPTRQRAEGFVQDGRYFWNCGIFVFQVSAIRQLYEKHQSALTRSLISLMKQKSLVNEDQFAQRYQLLPQSTFEFDVVEHAKNLYMVPAAFDWTDLGTWSALLSRTENPAQAGPGSVFSMESDNNLVYSESGLVGLYGVRDLIVIHSNGVVFVCHRDKEQDVKKFLSGLSSAHYRDYL